MMPDGRPFTVRKKYTWSMHEKATLRHHLEGWRGKAFETEDFGENGFDTRKLIGVPCVLTVTHEVKGDKTFANVASVGKIMRGLQPKPLFNETAYLSLEPGEFDKSVFEKLPDYVKNLIIASPEYAELTKKAPATQAGYAVGFGEPDPSDEIPF